MNPRARSVLDFWFADAASSPAALSARTDLWFGMDAAQQVSFDERIRREFGADVEAALRGALGDWARTAQGRLALILVLDQFPRNIFRGTARAFAGDAHALALVRAGMKNGADRVLPPLERVFFHMPLQHTEDAAAQSRGVEAFARLAAEAPPELHGMLESCATFARMHRDIVLRFGRFPHRNEALGRASTPAELEYLAAGAPDFGQSGR